MMAFIRTLILAVSLFVLTHEADAVVSDAFESATGTEMRVMSIAERYHQEQNAQYAEVNVMPTYTKAAKVARVKSTVKDFFRTVTSIGGSSAGSPVSISPAKL